MRSILLVFWLTLPALAGVYHFGPGQTGIKMDRVAQLVDKAKAASAAENWADALAAYEKALDLVDSKANPQLSQSIRLGKAQSQMFAGQLPEAAADLESLVTDMQGDSTADSQTRDEALSSLANAKFYLTWLKRLEGLGEADWLPDVENARQSYRQLAEDAEKAGNTAAAQTYRENLEGTIRLARMDVSELQGQPIPKQCQGCKSGQCKNPGRKPNPNGKKDGRGAGLGPAPDGSGS